MSRSRIGQVVLLASALALVSACGGGPDGAGGTSQAAGQPQAVPDTAAIVAAVQKDAQLNAALPDAVKKAGALHLASNIQSAPNNFYAADGKTPIGYEVDLAKAVAAKLGVTVAYQDMAFGSLITSLQSGRVDLTMAEIGRAHV